MRANLDREQVAQCIEWLTKGTNFFLHINMAAAKVSLEAAERIESSTIVTVFSRNGVEFGIKVSGLGEQWFTGPAGVIQGTYIPGYGPDDAARDLGDSAIMEAYGLGAPIQVVCPTLSSAYGVTVRGRFDDGVAIYREMSAMYIAKHSNYLIPALDFEAAPLGMDIRKVVELGIEPRINTAIAHKTKGGLIGLGPTRAPMEAFKSALKTFAAKYDIASVPAI